MPPFEPAEAYDAAFYASQSGGSYRSAGIVLERLLGVLPVGSVCDVGCGAGTWVKAFLEAGVADVLGVDGEHARGSLQIPQERFLARDLRQPLRLDRTFDLAISVEVAEHLPAERATGFVEDLTRLAPAVLFSAAVPYQGGTDHINERWQGVWASEFARRGYQAHDLIRPWIWDDAQVEVWYRQNILLYLRADHPLRARVEEAVRESPRPASVIHPAMFPLGFNMDSKRLLLKLLYWSFARDLRRWRARLPGA